MVPCHSCYIYGTWREQRGGEGGGFKVIIWGTRPQRGDQFYGGDLTPLDTVHNQYFMKNSLLALSNIVFGMNSMSLFSIFFAFFCIIWKY